MSRSFKRINNDNNNNSEDLGIANNIIPAKLVFRSRPTSPTNINETYKAPKINKGCLVETIGNYHSGVAKLYCPPKLRNNDKAIKHHRKYYQRHQMVRY